MDQLKIVSEERQAFSPASNQKDAERDMKLFLEARFQNVAIRMVAIGSEFPHNTQLSLWRECYIDGGMRRQTDKAAQHDSFHANDIQASSSCQISRKFLMS